MASKQRPLDLSEFCKTSFHAAASPDFTAVYMPCGSRVPPEQAFERFPLGTLETYHRVRQQIRHSAGHENIPKGCLAGSEPLEQLVDRLQPKTAHKHHRKRFEKMPMHGSW
jgi:hypothetical protein